MKEEIISLISLFFSCLSLYFSFKSRNRYKESDAPIILPNNKILIKQGTKITSAKDVGAFSVIEWTYK